MNGLDLADLDTYGAVKATELEMWFGLAGVAPIPEQADHPLAADYRILGAVNAVEAFDTLNLDRVDPARGTIRLPYRWLAGGRPDGEACSWPFRAVTVCLHAADHTGREVLVVLNAETTSETALSVIPGTVAPWTRYLMKGGSR